MLIDSHAHLTDKRLIRQLDDVLVRAAEADVGAIITIGTDAASSRAVAELVGHIPGLAGTVGVHPHDAKTVTTDVLEELANLAAGERIVAIGETGLDFYRDLSPRDKQEIAFIEQIHPARFAGGLAFEDGQRRVVGVADVYHQRQAQLAREVVHCWSSGLGDAQRVVDLGLHIGFTGTVTYPNANNLREVAATIPLDRILIETDCPYLTPHPHRKKVKTNEPAYVKYVAEQIAEVRGVSFDEVAATTTTNARELFGLDATPSMS